MVVGFQFGNSSTYKLPLSTISHQTTKRSEVFIQDIDLLVKTGKPLNKAINIQLEKISNYLQLKGTPLSLPEKDILKEIALCYFSPEGPLRHLLYDPDLEEICCNGLGPQNPVWVFSRKQKKFIPTNLYFTDFDYLRTLINNLTALQAGRRMDLKHPHVMALIELNGEKFRFTAVQERATSSSRIQFAIRKFTVDIYTPCDLINLNTLDAKTASLLWLIFQLGQRINTLIVGRPASGKTTFLQAFSLFIPQDQRIIDAEYQPELRFLQGNVAGLMSRPEEGITMAKLIEICERYRPDRFVVGEVVSKEEIMSLLDVLGRATGDGIYATYHASSAQTAVQTLSMHTREKSTPLDLVQLRLIVTLWPLRYLENDKEVFQRKLIELAEITPELSHDLPQIQYITNLDNKKYKWPKLKQSYVFDQLQAYFGSKKKFEKEGEIRTNLLEKLCRINLTAKEFYQFVQSFTQDQKFRQKTLEELSIT